MVHQQVPNGDIDQLATGHAIALGRLIRPSFSTMPRTASKAVHCVRAFAPGTSSRVRTQAQPAHEYLADILAFKAQGIIILRRLLANGLAGQ